MRQHTINTPYMVGEAHFYSMELNGDLVLFDTGPPTPEAIAYLQAVVDLRRLKYLFITHCHVDHYGLAEFIAKNSGAEVFISRKDAIKFRRHHERLEHIRELLRSYGYDRGFADRLQAVYDDKKIFPAFPGKYTLVEESDVPHKLGIDHIGCPGHSQSDLVYLCGKYAVTGDVLLRNIFQAPLLDVDLETFAGRFRNYDAYCASLLELQSVRGCEILPGHRQYVESLDETILFYVGKLMERAAQVKRLEGVALVRDVIAKLFGGALDDPFITYLKVSEIVFMRDFLAEPEKLKNSLEQIGLFGPVCDVYAAATG